MLVAVDGSRLDDGRAVVCREVKRCEHPVTLTVDGSTFDEGRAVV